MERIAAAGNIEPPIYHLIIAKGYKIAFEGEYIVAVSNDFKLIAYNLMELAALVFLAENKGENWKIDDELIDEYCSFIEENEK